RIDVDLYSPQWPGTRDAGPLRKRCAHEAVALLAWHELDTGHFGVRQLAVRDARQQSHATELCLVRAQLTLIDPEPLLDVRQRPDFLGGRLRCRERIAAHAPVRHGCGHASLPGAIVLPPTQRFPLGEPLLGEDAVGYRFERSLQTQCAA